jgi:hypothetical protein
VAAQKPKRRSRKRRTSGSPPPARPRGQASATTARPQRQPLHQGPRGTYGERPPSPFGGLPISELAIFVGGIGLVVGLIQGGGAALIVGLIVCCFGVVEVTAREHFTGYRSHTILLAALPAVAAGYAATVAFGTPRQRLTILVVVVPIYGLLFWLLRKRFETARQARIARPPAP